MKIGRNEKCSCGSGIKYKKCCHLLDDGSGRYPKISKIVEENGYDGKLTDVLFRAYRFLSEPTQYGACHFISSCLYVALSELGYNPDMYIGEVACWSINITYTHSWVELEGKVIDLATLYPNIDVFLDDLIILDISLKTNNKTELEFGVSGYADMGSMEMLNKTFIEYLDDYPYSPNGGWDTIRQILGENIDIEYLRDKYSDTNIINLYK